MKRGEDGGLIAGYGVREERCKPDGSLGEHRLEVERVEMRALTDELGMRSEQHAAGQVDDVLECVKDGELGCSDELLRRGRSWRVW